MIFKIPAGITADSQAMWGLFGLMSNVNNYSEQTAAVTTAGTNTAITAFQALVGVLILNSGASGAFTLTLPSTALLIAQLGPTIPTDGSYAEPVSFLNNGVGQTATLTAGDASTTITGTATIATNTTRKYIMTVTSPTTVTFQNCGSMSL